MEHKVCHCACCREGIAAPQQKEAIDLFPGIRLFYLPEAAVAAAAGEGDGVLRVYACRRGSLRFQTEAGQEQSLHAGGLAVWKEARFLDGTMTPDEAFAGLMVRVELKKLTEQPPQSLCGADITGERLYDLYCTQEEASIFPQEAEVSAILDMFYGKPDASAMSWRRLGAQALLLHLGKTES